MKITIRQDVLVEALNKGSIAAVINSETVENLSSISLINKSIKITAGKKMIIESSNHLMGTKYYIDAKEENGIKIIEEGEILVPAKEFIDWVKAQGKLSTISIQLQKSGSPEILSTQSQDEEANEVEVKIKKIGVVRVTSKDDNKTVGKWELDCYAPEHIKSISFSTKNGKMFDISSNYLLDILKNITFAASKKDIDHITDSISIQIYKKDIYFAATDKTRCAVYQIDNSKIENLQDQKSVLIPCFAMEQISKIIEKDQKISFSYDEENNKVFLNQPNMDIRITTTDKTYIEKFPDVKLLVEKDYKKLAEVSKTSLLKMLYTASIVNQFSALLKVSVDDSSLTIKAISEENKYKPNITHTPINKPLCDAKIVLHVSKMIEVLKIMKSDNIILYIPDNNKSLKLTGKDDNGFLYYTMVIADPKYNDE